MNHSPSILSKHTAWPSLFNLAAIALLLTMGGLGVAYWLDANARPAPRPEASTFSAPFESKNLAGVAMQIPSTWFNAPTRSNDEFVQSIDLALHVQLALNFKITTINMRLASINRSHPSSYLLDTVYAARFTREQLSGPLGLIGKPLRAEEGFQNEVIWYDPIAPNPFVAKCIDLKTSNSAPTCLRTVQISPRILVTYQFEAEQLQHWRTFDAAITPLLGQIGALAQ